MSEPETKWCVVRWMSSYTVAVLNERGEPGAEARNAKVCPKTGAVFCGPVTLMDIRNDGDVRYVTAGLGYTGFPGGNLGNVLQHDSREQAAEYTEHDGTHVSIDIPAPMNALHFSTRVYHHYDGKVETPYDGGDLRTAHAWRALAREEGGHGVNATVECRVLWDLLGENRPTLEQARAMFEVCRRLDEEAKESWRGLPA
jgi:hypothetical protein